MVLLKLIMQASVTSPHNSTGITPYTECAFNLSGVYGAENVSLTTNYLATTLFAGKVLFYSYCIIYSHSSYCISQ